MRVKYFIWNVFVLAVALLSNCGVVSQDDHCFAVVPNTMKGFLIIDVEAATSHLIQRPLELPDTPTLFDVAPVGWSEDGESLIIIEQYVEQNRLFNINLVTETVQEIASVPFGNVSLSPDGTMLAFFELQDLTQTQTSGFAPLNLRLLNLNSMQVRDVLDFDFKISGIYLLWSPDSKKLAVFAQLGRTQWTSLIVNVATNGQQHLVESEDTIAISYMFTGWSPQGDLIALEVDEDGQRSIQIIDVEARIISQTIPDAGSPVWSPDGKKLLFLDQEWQIMDIDTQVVEVIDLHGVEPSWSPDGTQILSFDLPTIELGEELPPFVWYPQHITLYSFSDGEAREVELPLEDDEILPMLPIVMWHPLCSNEDS